MSDQKDLFGYTKYPDRPGHVAGSDTSKMAADSIDDALLARLRRNIFSFIAARGEHGATCDEVEAELDLRHQTCSARIRELVLAGAIFDSGIRRLTRSRRSARVYRISVWAK